MTTNKNKPDRLLFLTCSLLIVSFGCNRAGQAVETKPENTFSVKGSVREMTIWPETPEFPEHPGKAEFVSYCGICHSLRYISTQPLFTRKTWDAEVHKMIGKYGAPVDSATAIKIVDYLLLVKGKQ